MVDVEDASVAPAPAEHGSRVVRVEPRRRGLVSRLGHRAARETRWLYWRCRLAEFGAGSSIEPPARLHGHAKIRIGRRVQIWANARIEAIETGNGAAGVIIGDMCVIHPFVHIGAADCVRVGHGVLMASHVYITDHDHDWSDPDDPVIGNGRLIVAPVTIGDFVWLGERVMVLKGATIGERSVIGAGSIVTKDVPPYSVAVGAPARVIRRYDHSRRVWVSAGEP